MRRVVARMGLRRLAPGRRRLRPEALEPRLAWVLGSPRTGSTWLLNLLRGHGRIIGLDEPLIGAHIGCFATEVVRLHPREIVPEQLLLRGWRADLPSYFFSERYESVWRPLLRDMILRRMAAEVGDRTDRMGIEDPFVVIKEPNGSQGAELLMSLLPAARLIFLVRDGRDVIDSELAALSQDGWVARLLGSHVTPERRLAFIRDSANIWLCQVRAVQRAFDRHAPGRRLLVRYEELLADPEARLMGMIRWLGLEIDRRAIGERVTALSFDRLDPERSGGTRFARAASPGLWRENLSAQEQSTINEMLGPALRELGY